MYRRPLGLLCLVYVVLDFANPLMPGAVSLSDGFVQALGAERRLEDAPPAPHASPLPPLARTDEELTVRISARLVLSQAARPRVRMPVKLLAPVSSPPSPLSEDH